jgi:hypothetical protein
MSHLAELTAGAGISGALSPETATATSDDVAAPSATAEQPPEVASSSREQHMEAAMDSEAQAAAEGGEDLRRRSKAARRSVSWATNLGVLPSSSAEDAPSAEAEASSAGGSTGAGEQLTAEAVAARAAELFPGDSAVPAVPPRLPAVVETFTAAICRWVFAAASAVPVVRGQRAREDASGYLAADLFGQELVPETREALAIGDAVRKAAAKLKEDEAAAKHAATTARGNARRAVRKTPELAPKLDSEILAIDTALEAKLQRLQQEEVHLNGMPERGTVVVERRPPKRTKHIASGLAVSVTQPIVDIYSESECDEEEEHLRGVLAELGPPNPHSRPC